MSRLTGHTVEEILRQGESIVREYVSESNVTLVLKNYTTLIGNEDKVYVVDSGNEALATPGSGDVLAGIIASMLAQGISRDKAAYLGAYIHGKAGVNASREEGIRGVLARDIADNIHTVIG